MEMFSFGKEASTLSQVSYFSVKEEAKEDIMGYKEVEPQNKICALKSELSEEASALLSPSFAVVLSAAVSLSLAAAVVEAVLPFASQATREEARRRPPSNKDSYFFIIFLPWNCINASSESEVFTLFVSKKTS